MGKDHDQNREIHIEYRELAPQVFIFNIYDLIIF